MRFLSNVLFGFGLVLLVATASARDPSDVVLAYGLQEIESPGRDPWKAQAWVSKYSGPPPLHVRIENGQLVLAHVIGTEQRQFPPRYETSSVRYITSRADGGYSSQLHAIFKDGKPRKQLATDVMAIVPRGSELLLFSGTMHMLDAGTIYRVASPDASPRVSLVTRLPEAPQVIVEDPKSPDRSHLFIVSSSSLMSIGKHDLLHIHHWDRFWAGNYPNSAVFYEDHLVIASSVCVVVVKLEQGFVVSTRYFAPKGHSVYLRAPPNSSQAAPKR